jgi:uncharacterized protein (DUF305 family)
METKSLLYGIIGFILGGLLVSLAATTFDKPVTEMSDMTSSLNDKTGDAYDQAFITNMIDHHQSAVDMARLSEKNAKHDQIKQLSKEIIKAQEHEINHMKNWQRDWGYPTDPIDGMHTNH